MKKLLLPIVFTPIMPMTSELIPSFTPEECDRDD